MDTLDGKTLCGIGVNSLWPRAAIATATLRMIPGIDVARCRKPAMRADAAWLVLTGDNRHTGNFCTDDPALAEHGITDLDRYAVTPGNRGFIADCFVD